MGYRAGGGGLVGYLPISDHEAEGVALLLAQFEDKPRIQALVESYLSEVQAAEDQVFLISFYRHLDYAYDSHLDVLGDLVGEPRNGRADAAYRNAIRVRVLVNDSNGRVETLIAIADLYESVEAGGGTVEITEFHPASLVVTLVDHAAADAAGLVERLRQAKAAGVKLDLVYLPTGSSADTFTLGGLDLSPWVALSTGTFSRASLATFWDGLTFTRYASGERRDVTFPADGYILEETRANEVLWCSDLTNAAWTVGAGGVASYGVAGPSGDLDASRIIFTAGTTPAAAQDLTTLADNTEYTASLFIRAEAYPQDVRVFMTLKDASVVVLGDVSTSGAWARYDFAAVDVLAGGTTPRIHIQNQVSLDQTVDVFLVQLEEGTFPTSGIETTTARAVRSRDTNTVTFPLLDEPFRFIWSPNTDSTALSGGMYPFRDATLSSHLFINTAANLTVRASGVNYATGAIVFNAFDLLDFAVDPAAGTVTVTGSTAIAGAQVFSGAAFTFPTETYVTGLLNDGSVFMSDIYPVYPSPLPANTDPDRGLGDTVSPPTGGALAGVA